VSGDAAISVVVPSYEGAARLPATLDALAASAPGVRFEVIVVDDGSRDGTAAAAGAFRKRLPLRVLRHEANRGRAAACNTGLRVAGGAVVLLLDDDMRAEPGMIERHLRAHRDGGPIAALGRIVQQGLSEDEPFHLFLRREEASRRQRLLAAGTIGFAEVWTGQFSVGREAALAAGLLDEGIRAYGLEDIEFAYRLAAAGTRFVYLDDAVSRHHAFADTLERYCARHASVGTVAAYLARRHDTPEMHRYLRIVPPRRAGASLFVRLIDLMSGLLRRPGAAAFFALPPVQAVLRSAILPAERLRLRRLLALIYSFMRDVQYFRALRRGLARHGEGG